MEYRKSGEPARAGEVDGARMAVLLWRRKGWIAACTTAVTLAGLVHAFLQTPIYRSQAIIGMKEASKGNDASRIFSQFGGMGGMVATQLGLGNANLSKVDILLRGHEMADVVINRDGMFAALYPDSAQRPPIRKAVEFLRRKILKVEADPKSNVLTVGIEFSDPEIAKRLVDGYLRALNERIRDDVIRDAEVNRDYLVRQLANTLDPILREKIQSMIGMEIEKSMLVSSQAFEILEKPVVPYKKIRPDRKIIVTLSFLLGVVLSLLGLGAAKAWAAFKAAERDLERA